MRVGVASSSAGPVKWIETRSENMAVSHHGRDQVDYVRMGGDVGRQDHRLPREHHPGPRRLLRAADADDPRARGVRDDRLLRDPGRADRHHRRADEQVLHRRDPRSGAPGDDAHARGHDRPARRRSWGWTRRAAPQELHRRPTQFPYETPYGITYDSGNYEAALDRALEMRRHGRLPRRAGGAARAGHPARHRLLHVHGDLRPRAVAGGRSERLRPRHRPLRVGARARAPDGLGDGLHRRLAARPGPRDGLRADRRRPPRHRSERRRGHPRRHGDGPDGPGHVRLALAGDRRRRGRARGREDRREVPRDRRPQPRGRRRATSRSAAGSSRCAAIPTRA